MRRRGAEVMAAAVVWGGLAAATLGQVRADEAPPAPVKTGGLWGLWFGGKAADKPGDKTAGQTTGKPAAETPAADATVVTPADGAAELPASTVFHQAAEALQHEKQAYLRRVEVCDRLRDIALETGNSDLERQADALALEAGRVWELRTARLPRPLSSEKTTGSGGKSEPSGGRTPLRNNRLQLPQGRKVGGGTVTGEEKP